MRLIRPAFVIRIAITLILTFGVLAMSSSPSFSYPGLAKDHHGHGKNGKSEKSGKKDKQEGKHQDNGKHKGKNKKEKKAKKVKAEPLAAYTVHVDCVYDADNPAGAKKINLLDLPSDEICAQVVGGDARYVDPDPNTGATGYRSTDP